MLGRFLEFFSDTNTIDAISNEDFTRFLVCLKKDHALGANTVLHNAVIPFAPRFCELPAPKQRPFNVHPVAATN